MIFLDRDLPDSCFNCPCFQVFTATTTDDKQYAVQFCQESGLVIHSHDMSQPLPDNWVFNGRMRWCKWREATVNTKRRTDRGLYAEIHIHDKSKL